MDASETANAGAEKPAVDQFTSAAFKDGVEKTLSAMAEANTQSKKNLEAVAASVSAAARGAETLGAQAVAYSKTAFETQVNAAKAIAAAKTPQEFFELQSAFAKSAFESYVGELGRFSETLAASAKASFKPINQRVTEVVGALQATR
ncbi:MAG TPA: TIGR01841 family phasin [Phenylobacterium sp.]|uniref:phasin family protein n=1 Tax=Phenylobacterium sp. TaxID=1871053 RepID=UPI002B97E237|nr:TIGR01841 family phasin [Phenylobacterium sp.]HSV04221.1 TIGR01841 family phasin [Phenylobacterium sp.]